MDQLTRYRGAVTAALTDWLDYLRRGHRGTAQEVDAVLDTERDNYLLTITGWDGGQRVREDVFYLRIRDGKIWVEEDNTDRPIADQLLRLGVPMEDIVLGFHPPDVRHRTGYGVRGPFAPAPAAG